MVRSGAVPFPRRRWALSLLRLAALAALGWTPGCYSSRWTGNYQDLYGGAIEKDNAVLEETGRDAVAEQSRLKFLQKLAKEKEPEYKINAGDQIEIRVYGHEDIGVVTRVSPDGRVGMVFLGEIDLAGRTLAEARNTIEEGLAPYVKHPVVGVTLLEVDSDKVTVSGAVAHPGLYKIAGSTRLSDAYAMAGGSAERLFNGVDVDVADLEHSILVRNGQIIPVDFKMAIEGGNQLDNVRLHKGDYIFVAQRMESSVTICGDVKNPHRRLYEPGMGLIETLTTAGWMQETHWGHVIIIRDGLANPKLYKVDVDGILIGKSKNVYLQPNDIVYVPKDNMSEYNVFVRKLLPTAQLINLLVSRVTAFTN